MTIVQAYKSKFDDILFPLNQRDGYIEHLTNIRQNNTKYRNRASALKEFNEFRDNAANSLNSVTGIKQWVINNIKTIARANMIFNNSGNKLSLMTEILKISFDRMKYSNHVSNHHNAPRNGVTNWGNKDKNNPTGYPGLCGQIHMLIDTHDIPGSDNITDILTRLGICTGSGGSGRYFTANNKICTQQSLSYEVTLFDSDWPCLSVTNKMNS